MRKRMGGWQRWNARAARREAADRPVPATPVVADRHAGERARSLDQLTATQERLVRDLVAATTAQQACPERAAPAGGPRAQDQGPIRFGGTVR